MLNPIKLIAKLCLHAKMHNYTIFSIIGESVEHGDENKLTVRMEKSRPTFFSRNLTEKTQVPLTDKSNTTVRPTGLG